MTVLGVGLMQPHPETVSLGNTIGGAVFVGGAYLLVASPLRLPRRVEDPAGPSEALAPTGTGTAR